MFYIVLDRLKSTNLYIYIFYFWAALFIAVPFGIVCISAFTVSDKGFKENLTFVNVDVFWALFRSLFVSIATIFFVILFSYPFAYWASQLKSFFYKLLVILFVTSPLWSSVFVKVIGLKSFFDLVNGEFNSARGLFYVILGFVYINMPSAIMNFYSVFSVVPKNIFNASLDLGGTHTETIFRILIPYTKESILSSVFLVFLPSFAAVTVADFMNRDPGTKLIGQLIRSYSEYGMSDSISRQRMSVLVLGFSLLTFIFYFLIKLVPSLFKKIFVKK